MGIFSGAGFLPPNWGEKSRLEDEAEDDADLDLKLRVLHNSDVLTIPPIIK